MTFQHDCVQLDSPDGASVSFGSCYLIVNFVRADRHASSVAVCNIYRRSLNPFIIY